LGSRVSRVLGIRTAKKLQEIEAFFVYETYFFDEVVYLSDKITFQINFKVRNRGNEKGGGSEKKKL